jgi:hypothetical protein
VRSAAAPTVSSDRCVQPGIWVDRCAEGGEFTLNPSEGFDRNGTKYGIAVPLIDRPNRIANFLRVHVAMANGEAEGGRPPACR